MERRYNPPYPSPLVWRQHLGMIAVRRTATLDQRSEISDKAKESGKRLSQAITSSHEILFSAKTVFPFTLFPDTITIDRERLTVARHFFFRMAEELSIRTEDILDITADVGPYFGSIKLRTAFFDPENPYTVNYLWRKDALRAKRIIQGSIIANHKKIDSSPLSASQLAQLLDSLGKGPLPEKPRSLPSTTGKR